MSAFQALATLLTIAAAFAYANHRWLKLPAAIALMAMSLGASLLLIAVDRLGWLSLAGTAGQMLERIDFNETRAMYSRSSCSSGTKSAGSSVPSTS